MTQTWRDVAKAVIAEVQARAAEEGYDYGRFKRELFEAYPFSMRQYYPYRVWCEEQRRALKQFRIECGMEKPERPETPDDWLPGIEA